MAETLGRFRSYLVEQLVGGAKPRRDMMLEAGLARFGGVRATHPFEWLSDNGSICTARETRVFAALLNLISCFTPVASHESSGMSEAFVKTLKRDYLRVSPVPEARHALDQIARWFDDTRIEYELTPAGLPARIASAPAPGVAAKARSAPRLFARTRG